MKKLLLHGACFTVLLIVLLQAGDLPHPWDEVIGFVAIAALTFAWMPALTRTLMTSETTGRVPMFLGIFLGIFAAFITASNVASLQDCLFAQICTVTDLRTHHADAPSGQNLGAPITLISGVVAFAAAFWLIRRPRAATQPA